MNLIEYKKIASQNIDSLYASLNTTADGITQEEADKRLEEYGHNTIRKHKKHNVLFRFSKSLFNPFNLVLLLIAFITLLTDVVFAGAGKQDYVTVAIILSLVLISTLMSFYQEERSNQAASDLLNSVTNTVSVYRDKQLVEILNNNLVVGDIISLGVGDLIPADIRYISTKDTFITQATLTGESVSLERFTDDPDVDKRAITDILNLSFMGSNIVSGIATAIVIATGDNTFVGGMSNQLEHTKTKSSFEKGISSISALLLRSMIIMIPAVFIINGVFKGNWTDSFLFSVTLAVGLTPSMLPMVMSTGLGRGALAMSKHKTIVKNLSAIQTFGEMDILCTDKTGTLTEDEIVLERYLDVHGVDDMRVLRHAYMNSYFQTGLKNLIDVAIINRAGIEGLADINSKYECIDEIPFDFSRRRMSVVVKDQDQKTQLITKGAVEEILSICSFVEYNGEIHPLNKEMLDEANAIYNKHNSEGLRMIAVAQKNEIPDEHTFSINDETDMVLIGFIGFLDPPKESAIETIKSLHHHGVDVVVLTGDSMGVALKVCSKVGIDVQHALSGVDTEDKSDEELKEIIPHVHLFAKLSPTQKQRVVSIYQSLGHTVGYLGDGINDALSLKQADVGISVDSAVDIAKETADIILLEKDLRVLEEGILEGRKTFGNIIKYIKLAVSGNFGNMISVLISSIFLKFLPMLPVHILFQNMLCDFAQMGIPFDNIDQDYLLKPQKWETKSITSFMVVFGLISSVFDILCYVIAWSVLGLQGRTPEEILMFQTFWFTYGILSQVLIIHFIRTNRVPFIQSMPSKALMLSTIGISLITMIIVFTPISFALDLSMLNPLDAMWLIIVLIGYTVVSLVGKTFYIKRTKRWL